MDQRHGWSQNKEVIPVDSAASEADPEARPARGLEGLSPTPRVLFRPASPELPEIMFAVP